MIRFLCLFLVLATPVFAVQPDEILEDPALEARARDISAGLRCLVCRNESIDESNAELARDLRLLVRERLVEGDSNEEVVDYIVARFGEYVLLTPRADGINLILWIAGPLLFCGGLLIAGLYVRRQRGADLQPGLSDEEKARLEALLNEKSE